MPTRRDTLGLLGAVASATAVNSDVQARSTDSAVLWPRPAHRDIPTPDWGPYSDHWNGISHVTDRERGLRMDFALTPAILRQESLVPFAHGGLNMQPVRADPDLSYYAWLYRLEAGVDVRLEWLRLSEAGGVLRARVRNLSDVACPVVLNWTARLCPPPCPARLERPRSSGIVHQAVPRTPLRPARVALPADAIWVNALFYDHFQWAKPGLDESLPYDGRRHGEVVEHGFVDGYGIGQGFGRAKGDQIRWRVKLAKPLSNAVLRLRYRCAFPAASFAARGLFSGVVTLAGGDDPQAFIERDLALGRLAAGEHDWLLTALGDAAVELNGFVLVEHDVADAVRFTSHDWALRPRRRDGAGSTVLAFAEETDSTYALSWTDEILPIRTVANDDLRLLDIALKSPARFAMGRVPDAETPEHVTVLTHRVFDLQPGQTAWRDLRVAVGQGGAAAELPVADAGALDRQFAAARAEFGDVDRVAGDPYAESAERLLATAATNMLFPIWTGGAWVRSYSPGREWPSVYTWDSGFTGLGLAKRAPRLSTALLDTYLSPAQDRQAAFLHHGSPLPTQFYQFEALWNLNGDRAFAQARYPRLKRYLEFLLGRAAGSTCRTLGSGLVRTYDYFYNAAGMDDYPAQMAMHAGGLAGRVAPAVSTAHAIRCAKLLRRVASTLDLRRDVDVWRRDIEALGQALQTHAWDPRSGYYAYVLHDAAGAPTGWLRSPAGENFNMGLDGVAPLVADIADAVQRRAMIDNLMSPERMWTPSGITAVDQRASYFDRAGYWSGSVWMPHQWLMWKAMLDYGEGALAWRIARTALDVYSREIARTGLAYEQFDAFTGRGGGWSPFGALSSPIRNWYEAYCQPRTLSGGFNTHIRQQHWSAQGLVARLNVEGDHAASVLVVADRSPRRASWRGQAVDITLRGERAAEIVLAPGEGVLELVCA